MLRDGLVHVVASDAHDAVKRPPGLNDGFAALERELPGLAELQPWMTERGPARDPRRHAAAGAPAAARARRPAAPARAQSLTIAITDAREHEHHDQHLHPVEERGHAR